MIVEFGGNYLLWCIHSDAPKTKLMTAYELQELLIGMLGPEALAIFHDRMQRVAANGTSSTRGLTKDELLAINKAGVNGAAINTEPEMVRAYSR